jgi:UrcA family protein
MTMSKQTTIAAIASVVATLGLFALTPPAFAAAPAQGEAREVRHTDLDLKSAAGQAELTRRIQHAARAVCGLDAAQTGTRIPSRANQECYRNALRQIEPQFARLIDTKRSGA